MRLVMILIGVTAMVVGGLWSHKRASAVIMPPKTYEIVTKSECNGDCLHKNGTCKTTENCTCPDRVREIQYVCDPETQTAMILARGLKNPGCPHGGWTHGPHGPGLLIAMTCASAPDCQDHRMMMVAPINDNDLWRALPDTESMQKDLYAKIFGHSDHGGPTLLISNSGDHGPCTEGADCHYIPDIFELKDEPHGKK